MVRILKARRHRTRPSRGVGASRLLLESLETRNLLTTFTVINTNDSGTGSLAQAILDANGQAIVGGVPNTIAFNIPGTGVHKISLQNALPVLTNPVVINGYTQPGASPNTNPIDQPDNAVLQVQIDGSQVPFAQGLVVGKGAAGSTIEGLVINGFSNQTAAGISLSSTDGGNHVVGNFIGVDPTGMIASTTNSNDFGVAVMGPNNVIGGTNPADRNVISGNHIYGVFVTGAAASNNLIEGNYLGLKADGNSAFTIGFSQESVLIDHTSGTTLGGSSTAARNVIAGADAIALNTASNTTIQGNYVGIDRTGTIPVVSLKGLTITGSSGTQIGGNTPGAANVFGGNPGAATQVGMTIDLSSATTIQGNFFGTDPSGTHNLGPFSLGITVQRSTATTIGGTDPGEGNVIANDLFGGSGTSIYIPPTGSLVNDVLIEGNSLYGNDSGAIIGSNVLPPFLTGATSTTITGHIQGVAGSTYRVEYFATPNTGGTSDVQGQTLIGFQDGLVADSSGNVPLSFSPVGGVPAGEFITATATKDGVSTSDFNPGVVASSAAPSADVGVAVTAAPKPVTAGSDVTFTITVTNAGPDAAAQAALATAVPAGTTFVSLSAPAGWTVNTPAVGGTGSIGASIGSLASGGPAVFSLVVHVDQAAAAGATVALSSTVSTTTADSNSSNQSASDSTTVAGETSTSADVGVTVTAAPKPVSAGGDVTFTIAVTNAGPDAAAQAALATAVPAGAHFVSLSAPAGWTVNTPAVGGTGAVGASIASLAAGGQAVFTLIVRVDPSAAAGATVALSSTVSTTTADSNSGNQSASASTNVAAVAAPSADVGVTVSTSQNPVSAGGDATFTITVTNAGPDAAAQAALATAVPAGTHFVSLSAPAGWTVSAPAVGGTGAVGASTASLAAGERAIFTLVVHVDPTAAAGATVALANTVSATTADSNLGNQSASASTTVASQPVPVAVVGPQVSLLQRFGVHEHPTVLVLGFNAPLDAASAQAVGNYRITGPTGRTIAVQSAVYDAATRTVTLHPSQRLNVHWTYQLLVNGTTATGVHGANGALLYGAGQGTPGSDYRAVLNMSTLVQTPAPAHTARHPHGPVVIHRVVHPARTGRR